MSVTQCLREEHRIILRVLDCFEVALNEAQQSGDWPIETMRAFTVFFEDFADRCHHCKEEGRLFPTLESAGIPREGGPIGVMLEEHERGRMFVRAMKDDIANIENNAQPAKASLLEHGIQFIDLLRGHIMKEDNILFNMADQVIQGSDANALQQAFNEEQQAEDYCNRFDQCRKLADDLIHQYNVPPL